MIRRRTGRTISWRVVTPPRHQITASAHSLSARTWTTTRSTTKRIISLRSAAVVSGAFQSVGRSLDRARIRARWSSLRCGGCSLQKTIIFLCEIALIPHRLLRNLAPSRRHETTLGLDGPILPCGTFRLIGGPLQAVLPVAVQAVALCARPGSLSGQLQGGGAPKHGKTCWATRSSTAPKLSRPQHVDPSFFRRIHP